MEELDLEDFGESHSICTAAYIRTDDLFSTCRAMVSYQRVHRLEFTTSRQNTYRLSHVPMLIMHGVRRSSLALHPIISVHGRYTRKWMTFRTLLI